MRRKILIAFLIVVGAIFVTGNAFAAWTQAKGHAYNQLTISHYTSNSKYSTFDEEGLTVDNHKKDAAKFTSTNLTYYGAYGITDKITLSLTVPYKKIVSEDVEGVLNTNEEGPKGIGDIDVGLRYNISQNIFAGVLMSVDAKVKIPAAYKCESPLQYQSLGDCQYDTQLSLVFGKGFGWGYAILDIGYKYRFESTEFGTHKPADVFKMRIDAGTGLTSKLWLRGSIDWSNHLNNATVSQSFRDYARLNIQGFDIGTEDNKLIRDTLGSESDALGVGVALAYTINSQFSAVLGFETTIEGFGYFESTNAGIGQTYSLAGVYSF